MLLGPRAVLVRLRRTPLLRWPQTPRRARQSRAWLHLRYGAGDGNRTRDPELGRLALYQLSYSRSPLHPQNWWRGEDSNLRRHTPADLQSAPFGHSGTSPQQILNSNTPGWSRWSESNRRPADYKSAALPLSYIGGRAAPRPGAPFETFPQPPWPFRVRSGSGEEHQHLYW